MKDRLIDVRAVGERLGVSTRQIWKLTSSGRLPRPIRLGRSVRWREGDIAAFIAADCQMDRYEAEREVVAT